MDRRSRIVLIDKARLVFFKREHCFDLTVNLFIALTEVVSSVLTVNNQDWNKGISVM